MLFATNAIRIRDQRSCSIIIRVIRSIISEFVPQPERKTSPDRLASPPQSSESDEEQEAPEFPIPPDTAAEIREYISSDVLKACVASFHDPAFVDVQKELAILVAQIVVYYGPFTDTARQLLLSLPSVREQDLNRLADFVDKPTSNTRLQRAIVLDLLKDVKAVSVSEMGKLSKSAAAIGSANGKTASGGAANRNADGGAGASSATTTASNKRSDRSKMAQRFMEQPAQGSNASAVLGAPKAEPVESDSGIMEGLEDISVLFDS